MINKIKNQVSESFGYEWNLFISGKTERNSLFGRTTIDDLNYFLKSVGLNKNQIKDKLILDAGCGSGRLTKQLAKLGAKKVYGVDIHSSINKVKENCRDIPNLRIIQADIFNLPFKSNIFDVVWCNGVIHHTADPYLAFHKLVKIVKPGGKLYIWVYEKKFSPYKFVKDVFRFTHLDRLSYPLLFKVCQLFSIISVIFHSIYKIVTIPIYPFYNRSRYFLKTLRKRSYEEFLMTWFDILSPKYDFRYSKKQIIKWFTENGFKNLLFYENQIGICGTKIK
ncbi:hypothetical protein COV53_00470 [Candidatus Gottesmanbacteria bacterium CG11_big_fil_rev_8_21_14_0_20_37_11]|uniref:Methyltransferase type 11 domain-containing protein n=2 Tax=Candidatus Gottesmaniibacteriota TaxID=1752720 RepID=A0A2M7RQQ9_9BACT|nr:MAG: hypothetical protein COV53_00470 [Candidatus Gottesmanbacteria bacterium CG11_big_fil_rev_8_21_14_0_20_37_11]PIZ02294.1 MAG: hypothetical protein COY59_05570 [Candidatus Gottesmanbacteria bacterium CG_4_10_14_0_8_um_filter_37_24]